MSQKNVAIQPGTLQVEATQLTAGDTDFDGNGPSMYLNTSLYVANEFQLGLNCHVRFQETEDDWTTWQGSFTGIILDIRNQGINNKILSVVTPPFSYSKTLNGYGTHHFDFGFAGLVQSVDAVGDSDGGWGGDDDHPQVSLIFNNITIDVEDPPPPASDPKQNWMHTYLPGFEIKFAPKRAIIKPKKK